MTTLAEKQWVGATEEDKRDAFLAFSQSSAQGEPGFMDLTVEQKIEFLTPCEVCGRTKAWHMINHSKHAFSTDGSLQLAEPSPSPEPDDPESREQAVGIVQRPADLALRALLVKKGLIDPQQLLAIEAEIEATGMVIVDRPKSSDQGG